MDEAAEVFGVAVLLLIHPCVTNGWGFIGFQVLIALEILVLADDTSEVLSVCLCLISKSPRYLF